MSGLSWTGPLPFFSAEELGSGDDGTIRLDIRFASKLPELRQEWGGPLNTTSVCRTPAHNKAVGGHPRSLHLTENEAHPTYGTMAADVYWSAWEAELQKALAQLALDHGFSVGLHKAFMHLDLRTEIGLPQTVFTYPEWHNEWSPDDLEVA